MSDKINSFKELIVWQKADEMVHIIFDCTDSFSKEYIYDLTSQLRRAALSIPTNIAEGCASVHSKEFINFLGISRRSLSETYYLLIFAYKRKLIDENMFKRLEMYIEEISKMINGLIKSIRNKLNTRHLTLDT